MTSQMTVQDSTKQEQKDGKPVIKMFIPNNHQISFDLGMFSVSQTTFTNRYVWANTVVNVTSGSYDSESFGKFGLYQLQVQACLSILDKRCGSAYLRPVCEEVVQDLIAYLTTAGYHVEVIENTLIVP